MAEPASSLFSLNAALTSLQLNRLRLDAIGSLEADSNGATTNGGGAFINNSGGTRSVGDVVIIDTSANDRFTTTTAVADGRVLGVVVDGSIANGVKGAIQTRGPVLVNVTGTVNRGDYLVTSATGGLAQSNGTTVAHGVFGVALEASSGGTVVALLQSPTLFPQAVQTFTPTLTQSASITLSTATGQYILLGKLLLGRVFVQASSAGTAANAIVLGGLPFAQSNDGFPKAWGQFARSGNNPNYLLVGTWLSSTTLSLDSGAGATGAFGVNPAVTIASGDSLALFLNYIIP